VTTTDPSATHWIDYVDPDTVPLAVRNPKDHDLGALINSLHRFGFTTPGMLDERTGRVVIGHGRMEALTRIRDGKGDPPKGVVVNDDGKWLVPIIRGWESRDDAHAEAYIIADNRTTEAGGWLDDVLGGMLSELAASNPELLGSTGFDGEDLDRLLADSAVGDLAPWDAEVGGVRERNDDEAETGERNSHTTAAPAAGREIDGDADDAPEPADEISPLSRPGDVWVLGPHKVVCGDATDEGVVSALLGDETATCMWTDPPYGVNYVGKTKDALTIENDSGLNLEELLAGAFKGAIAALRPGAPVYIAHPPGPLQMVFMRQMVDAGLLFRQQLVWVKNQFVLGRSDYHYRHEPILYGFTPAPDGSGRLGRGGDWWFGDHAQDSVFHVDRPSRSEEHPTMKPVDLIVEMLRNSCPPKGGIVYEPFGGSGSTMVAAHIIGAAARLVEIDPKYVDVICRRYQQLTGEMPVREGSDDPVDFIGYYV